MRTRSSLGTALSLTFGSIATVSAIAACGSSGERVTGNSGFPDAAGTKIDASGSDGGPILGNFDGSLFNTDGQVTASDAGCAAVSQKAELQPLDLYIMLDSSGSMNSNAKWTSVKSALFSFFDAPAATGLSVGIQYFPLFDGSYVVCDQNEYATPAVSFLTLPTGSLGIETNIANHTPNGGTPTGPALQGALQFAQSWAVQNPTHVVVVVFATDGIPDESCAFAPAGREPNTIAGAQDAAMKAVAASPSVKTYVIGVGSELTSLNAIAASGGTEQAFIVDVNGDTGGQFLDAMNQIRTKSLSCDYVIPATNNGEPIDYTKVNVEFSIGNGTAPIPFLQVPNASDCSQAEPGGWYYDNPAAPKQVVICDDVCGAVKASTGGQVNVLFGCKTNVAVLK